MPSPCATGVTLQAALASGVVVSADGRTYTAADGAVSTAEGVPVWVASAPRSVEVTVSSTTQYRVFFELNGNIHTGVLIRDGTRLGGSYYVSNPAGLTVQSRLTFLPFQIRLNKAARDSVAAAMAI